jgi:Golgi phosphoprotein 3 (GPP34)
VLIAEDLLLLVTDEASGRLRVPSAQLDAGLGGANLIELTLMNRVDISGASDQGKPGRLIVRDPSLTDDIILDAALRIVAAHRGKKPSAVIRPLARKLRVTLYQRLASGGSVRMEQSGVLGIFPIRRWPAENASHERHVRHLVTQALTQREDPDPRTAALVALLHALRCEHKIINPGQHGVSRRQLRARAQEIAAGNWASQAVRKAIDEMIAATAAAVAAASSG